LRLVDARANAVRIDFAKTPPKRPSFLGIKSFAEYDLAERPKFPAADHNRTLTRRKALKTESHAKS